MTTRPLGQNVSLMLLLNIVGVSTLLRLALSCTWKQVKAARAIVIHKKNVSVVSKGGV